ncbi:mannose-6-phosphate isomerase [Renibacterium salmoninarum ATCC 33209]|uniref:mannose-6-phosphate isomerase n=1 Tax=Renibacterium salmoninarum (strain ATCC 33209 / DSM 20767 / JCM 11484 / NBRC 15589 / NCIMB 2235) TaxID=288705 RepID=A9WU76_RENSM|nr:mannose-6-phosphate isomerase, class I [Renibacterium salmoninarum]ABY24747.1 mannose-6-phosphate isomerase [Renibacterium salmoninarum ATCC 33209]
MYKLDNVLRPYAWGSTTAIAELLGRPASGGPEAELWFGAHPGAPSIAKTPQGDISLGELINADPAGTLGAQSRAAFGDRLPYLMKLLAAGQALSLQVHPSLAQARLGFAAEEAAGVPRDAENRNYRDDNHKPEMIFALTPFDALCGFRPAAESASKFDLLAKATANSTLAEIASILDSSAADALHQAFELLINGGLAVTEALAAALAWLSDRDDLDPALRTVVKLSAGYPGDPGALISLLLNLVHLEPGECFAMPAGNVHAYLHGLGVEVMAASDNVLRGGLTSKHIDVAELLRTIDFRALPVPLVEATETSLGQQIFAANFAEFQLQRISMAAGAAPVPLAQNGPLLVLLVDGSALLDSQRGDLALGRGESAFVSAVEEPAILHSSEGCLAFAVSTSLRG